MSRSPLCVEGVGENRVREMELVISSRRGEWVAALPSCFVTPENSEYISSAVVSFREIVPSPSSIESRSNAEFRNQIEMLSSIIARSSTSGAVTVRFKGQLLIKNISPSDSWGGGFGRFNDLIGSVRIDAIMAIHIQFVF